MPMRDPTSSEALSPAQARHARSGTVPAWSGASYRQGVTGGRPLILCDCEQEKKEVPPHTGITACRHARLATTSRRTTNGLSKAAFRKGERVEVPVRFGARLRELFEMARTSSQAVARAMTCGKRPLCKNERGDKPSAAVLARRCVALFATDQQLQRTPRSREGSDEHELTAAERGVVATTLAGGGQDHRSDVAASPLDALLGDRTYLMRKLGKKVVARQQLWNGPLRQWNWRGPGLTTSRWTTYSSTVRPSPSTAGGHKRRSLSPNGRSKVHCHPASAAWPPNGKPREAHSATTSAPALLSVHHSEEQDRMAHRIVAEGLSVRAVAVGPWSGPANAFSWMGRRGLPLSAPRT